MAGQTIVISVLADTKKLASGLNDAGSKLGGLGKFAKTGAKVAVGAIAGIGAAVVGLAAAGGISRALNIDTAQTKLKALGYDAQEMSGIMDSALASVRGTAFGLGDAATLASQALAAGIPQGEELTKSLTLVTNTAALAGVGLGDMGSIFAKVWTSGRVGTQELNQLADRGIPVWTTLADSLGVGVDQLRKMVSAGQVTAEMFENGLGPAVEGIAGTMGTSFTGMVANLQAALGRVGAMFAGPAIEHAKPWIAFLTTGIDKIAAMLGPLADRFDAFLGNLAPPDLDSLFGNFNPSSLIDAIMAGIQGAADWIESGGTLALVKSIGAGREALLNGALKLFASIVEALPQILPALADSLLYLIQDSVNILVASAPQILSAATQMFTTLIASLAVVLPQIVTSLAGMLPVLIGSLLTFVPTLLDAATQMFTALVNAIPVVLPQLVDTIADMLPNLVTTVLDMLPAILDAAVGLFTALVEAIPVILPVLLAAVIKLIPRIVTTVIGMLPKLLDAAVRLFTGIVSAIPKIIPKLIPAILGLLPKIISALVGMIPKLIQAGIDLIGGLVKGLLRAAGSVGSALVNIAKNAVKGFLGFLGIHSPSRLFAGYGKNLIQGLVGGLDGNKNLVSRSLDGLAATVGAFEAPPLSLSPAGALTAPTVASSYAQNSRVSDAGGNVIELSPYDRSLLIEIADRVGITISGQTLQAVVNGSNANVAQRRRA